MTQGKKITKQDLEDGLRKFQGGVEKQVEDRKQSLVATGAAVGVIILLIFFLLGRRSGKKKTTVVEIRRV